MYHGNSLIYNLKAGYVDENLALKDIITQLNLLLFSTCLIKLKKSEYNDSPSITSASKKLMVKKKNVSNLIISACCGGVTPED